MNDVLAGARSLAEAFKTSPEYQSYLSAKNAAFSDPELARRLIDYKKSHFGYRLRVISGEIPAFDEEKVLSNTYSDLILNGKAREFLEREADVFGLINGINDALGEAFGEMDLEL